MGTEFPLEKLGWVDGLAQITYLIVEMRRFALPGVSRGAEQVAFVDDVSRFHLHIFEV